MRNFKNEGGAPADIPSKASSILAVIGSTPSTGKGNQTTKNLKVLFFCLQVYLPALAVEGCRGPRVTVYPSSQETFDLSGAELKELKNRALFEKDVIAALRITQYYGCSRNIRKDELYWMVIAARLGSRESADYLRSSKTIEAEYNRYFARSLESDLINKGELY